jgi:hypothetical protein
MGVPMFFVFFFWVNFCIAMTKQIGELFCSVNFKKIAKTLQKFAKLFKP